MNRHMMRQAQELQAKLQKTQEELADETVEASAGGGAVTVVVTGQQEVKSVKISPEVVDAEDVEMLEDLVLSALNEAMRKSQELAASRLGALTGGLKLPGLT
jgi:DNA-binding YbaB/EbfC family protein